MKFKESIVKEIVFMCLAAVVIAVDVKLIDPSDPEKAPKRLSGVLYEAGVIVLTDKNFDEVVNSKKVILVEFYAPWCGHCKELAPEYSKAAELLSARDPPLNGILAKVDATTEKEVAAKFKIEGYPTLKLFQDGKESGAYDGGRTAAEIAEFMAQRSDPNYKPPPSAVVTLTNENFTLFAATNEYFLIEFYAPWCGHCKSLAPVYERAAKRLKEEDPPIPVTKIDGTVETELAKKYGVDGYPTLKLMRKSKTYEYKGDRTEDGIVEYMIKNRRDAHSKVETLRELNALIPEARPLILGYFPSGSRLALEFIMVEATNQVRDDFVSAITHSEEVAKEYGIISPSVLMIYPERFRSKFEPKSVRYEAAQVSLDSMTEFFTKNQFPLVGHLNWDTMKYYDSIKNQTFCTVFYTVDFSFEHRKATQLWRSKLLEVAKEFKGSVVFAIANDEDFEDRMQAFNFVETGVDMNIGCLKAGIRYMMPEMDEYDKDHIVSFIKDLEAGKAKPFLKSQPIPKKQTEPVGTVVANNYEKMVLDESKDVLIEYYSPTCGHCTKFAPVYEKLASQLKHIKSLSILKMNAKDNDVPPPTVVDFFPTFRFRASGNKELVKYEGNRTIESLIEFMAKHAVSSKSELEAESKKISKETKKEKKDEL